MKYSLETLRSRIDVIDNPESDNVLINVFHHSSPAGSHDQIIMKRYVAVALGYILAGQALTSNR